MKKLVLLYVCVCVWGEKHLTCIRKIRSAVNGFLCIHIWKMIHLNVVTILEKEKKKINTKRFNNPTR